MRTVLEDMMMRDQKGNTEFVQGMPVFTPRHLQQFELLLLTAAEVTKFEEIFKERRFQEPNPLFQSWLPLKLASLPSEAESFQAVLETHNPKNLPQRIKKSVRQMPVGPARFLLLLLLFILLLLLLLFLFCPGCFH